MLLNSGIVTIATTWFNIQHQQLEQLIKQQQRRKQKQLIKEQLQQQNETLSNYLKIKLKSICYVKGKNVLLNKMQRHQRLKTQKRKK